MPATTAIVEDELCQRAIAVRLRVDRILVGAIGPWLMNFVPSQRKGYAELQKHTCQRAVHCMTITLIINLDKK